ncbi:hypothetical protein ID866_11388 [Astraeus odoratus]|nr:hypothetical protein ID866_11388 [Astraeus odoratus]
MFSLTQDDKDAVEGLSDEKPIRLDGVSKNDFEQLLKVLFHRKLGPLPCLPVSIEEWTSVLKLSTTWEFKVTRQAAIDALDVLQIGPVDRVALARKYNIKSWLLPALNKLAQRPKPTSLEEAGRMGIDFALKLASVREGITATHTSPPQLHLSQTSRVILGSSRDDVQSLDFTSQIRTAFGL